MRKTLALIFLSAVIFSCSNKVENVESAFYYWKSNSNLDGQEKDILEKLKIKKIYVKFFEVDHNEAMGNFPISKSELSSYSFGYDSTTVIVPTVYLRNEVFLKSDKSALNTLADNVNYLISKFHNEKYEHFGALTELQMDCDWTLNSRDNYFYFLKKLKAISKKKISCTLRLYPYKYPDKMGVPPVDKVILMCYNLINPLQNKNKNSILDLDELSAYLDKKRDYPLHIDIALPLFSWMQVYQNNQFSGVFHKNVKELKGILKKDKPLWYEVTRDTVVDDIYLRVGDKVKAEEITATKLEKAIAIIKKNVRLDENTTIALFHLDKQVINQYSDEEISRFYSDFSK